MGKINVYTNLLTSINEIIYFLRTKHWFMLMLFEKKS